MEKELDVERERDKARNIRILEPKLNISEPPPKVVVSFHMLFVCSYTQLQQHIRPNSRCILFTPPAFQRQY